MMKIKDVMVCISKRAIKDVKKNKKYLIHPNNAEKKEQMSKEQM